MTDIMRSTYTTASNYTGASIYIVASTCPAASTYIVASTYIIVESTYTIASAYIVAVLPPLIQWTMEQASSGLCDILLLDMLTCTAHSLLSKHPDYLKAQFTLICTTATLKKF